MDFKVNTATVNAPVSTPKAAAPKLVTEAAAAKPKSALDTFSQTVVSAQAGAGVTSMIGGVGVGAMTYFGMKEAPAFHRGLFTLFGGLGGAAAGAVAGGLGAVVAGVASDTKSHGAMTGGATGAVAGAVAGAAMSLKSGKGFDVKAVAGLAVAGAALGAIGGFSGVAAKNAIK